MRCAVVWLCLLSRAAAIPHSALCWKVQTAILCSNWQQEGKAENKTKQKMLLTFSAKFRHSVGALAKCTSCHARTMNACTMIFMHNRLLMSFNWLMIVFWIQHRRSSTPPVHWLHLYTLVIIMAGSTICTWLRILQKNKSMLDSLCSYYGFQGNRMSLS